MVSVSDFYTRKFQLECEIARFEKLGSLSDTEKALCSAYSRQLEILNEYMGGADTSKAATASQKGQGSLF